MPKEPKNQLKLIKNMMNTDQSLEYQKLRDEYALLANMIATTVTFSVAGTVAIFGLIISSAPSIFLFALPLLIIYPACLIIISRLQSIIRIASYIYVFLEPLGDLNYETRYLKFKTKSKCKLVFSQTILLIYAGLIVINIALFWTKGFTSVRDYIFYGISFIILVSLFFFIKTNWREQFIDYWKEIKIVEENINGN